MTDENRTYLVDKDRTYYVWRSDDRSMNVIEATSARNAAHWFALNHRVPCTVALRVVDAGHVQSFGFELK